MDLGFVRTRLQAYDRTRIVIVTVDNFWKRNMLWICLYTKGYPIMKCKILSTTGQGYFEEQEYTVPHRHDNEIRTNQ